MLKSLYVRAHERILRQARTANVSAHVAALLPERGTVLDVGCGSGILTRAIQARCPGLAITGVDVIPESHPEVPYVRYSGGALPFADGAYDWVMLIDMLHHVEQWQALLKEAVRVAKHGVVVKDHYAENALDRAVLRCMDYSRNPLEGMELHEYLSRARWNAALAATGLVRQEERTHVPIYGWPLDLVFGGRLHFVGKYARG